MFKDFIERNLLSYFREHRTSILILDSCRFHHRQDVIRFLNENYILYKFLPPYSPQLNPIEEYFGALKACFKNIRPRPQTAQDIRRVVNELLDDHNNSFESSFNRMRGFLLLGISRQPFI